METAYDWVTVVIFSGLVTRFLFQSAKPEAAGDSMWHYLVPSAGCAAANWLGNEGWDWPAIALIAATLLYIFYFLGGRSPSPPNG